MTKTTATGYIIAALFGAALFISHCGSQPGTQTIIKTERIYDTTTHVIKGDSIPSPIKIVHDTIPANVDTAAILKDYYAHKEYERYYVDSNIVITVQDTVHKNALGKATLLYKWKKPTEIKYTLAPEKKRSVLFVGGEAGTMGLGVSAGYQFRSNVLIDAAYYPAGSGIRIGVKYGIKLF